MGTLFGCVYVGVSSLLCVIALGDGYLLLATWWGGGRADVRARNTRDRASRRRIGWRGSVEDAREIFFYFYDRDASLVSVTRFAIVFLNSAPYKAG